MHPYNATPKCPRCGKSVYAAEQVMGPGRRLYHKPCLACTSCNKRLDSFTLLEHDQDPYCKQCHGRNFGTRDLRQANLPHRDEAVIPPERTVFPVSSTSPLKPHLTGLGPSDKDSEVTTITSGPIEPQKSESNQVEPDNEPEKQSEQEAEEEAEERKDEVPNGNDIGASVPPRTVPFSSIRPGAFKHRSALSLDTASRTTTLGRSNSSASGSLSPKPLIQTSTGTRYGALLTGGSISPKKQWTGNANPSCPKCGKSVYFAEQVKAVGKTYHKACLRCTQCNTSLDSTRLTEKEGEPYCHRCYSKTRGPQGGGYALLGKAGS